MIATAHYSNKLTCVLVTLSSTGASFKRYSVSLLNTVTCFDPFTAEGWIRKEWRLLSNHNKVALLSAGEPVLAHRGRDLTYHSLICSCLNGQFSLL